MPIEKNFMKKVEQILRFCLVCVILAGLFSPMAKAQEKLTQDTMECFIVGFSFGTMFPDGKVSYAKDPFGVNNDKLTMKSMYKAPYLDFGLDVLYKYKSNWLVDLNGDFWIGNDNLQDRVERLEGVYNSNGIVMAVNGVDGVFTCYNRGLSLKAGLGKVIVTDKKNPNSGILVKAGTGIMMSKTIFSQDIHEAHAYQLADKYLKLYDQRRFGWMLTEGVGYWFMSNRLNLVNIYAVFEVSQCWMHSTREYSIDKLAGLRGKDNTKHFDMLYNIKLCWMFPLKGKTVYDYYYF